ncbi:MAG: ATP-binding cassette domain-containing protein [Acidobacteria bacterium]|nr:ATP-binding cassette domain-containing protein [Acidobacteriota bacterium]
MSNVSSLSKSFGAQTLFSDVTFKLDPGHRYGLVGANGSGKTTLLNILAGDEHASSGTVSVPKRLKLGVLRQNQFQYDRELILEVVMMGNRELWEAMVGKDQLLENAESEFDADKYAELEDIVVRHDGYAAEARAGEILEGLGLPTETHRQSLSTLSGGFKFRVLLAQVLAGQPDVLLLDEPTNHLDILSIRWLEKFLQNYAGTAVVISHDHRFLDNVCTQILDVDYATVIGYVGTYTEFVEGKQAERERREKEIGKRQKEIAHHQQFVDRFRAKASKARQAQSKLRLIEKKADSLEALPESSRRYPKFRFDQVRPSGREVLTIEGVTKAFDDNEVLHGVDLQVRRGDRLAIMGPNGIGKSTLLKIAMGQLEADVGEVEWGYEAQPGYFAQDYRAALVPEEQTVEAAVADVAAGETRGFVRNHLGMVLFSGDEAEKRLGALSGGEAARLVFCQLAITKPNVLVLDEPTNHLDLEAIEALVAGLRDYPGTLIFVSHDRWFVSKLATRILEVKPTEILDYVGTYDEYVHYCGDDHLDADSVVLKAKREKRDKRAERKSRAAEREAKRAAETPAIQARRRELSAQRDKLVKAIDAAEKRIAEINEVFADPTYYERTSHDDVVALQTDLKHVETTLEKAMADWQALEDKIEALG